MPQSPQTTVGSITTEAVSAASTAYALPPSPSLIMSMQRGYGNKAVQRLLHHPNERAPEVAPQDVPTVQGLFGGDLTERQKIEKALKSDDPSDIKAIKDFNQANEKEKIDLASALAFNYRLFFGPSDRSTMWAIWSSFGNNLAGAANRNMPTWEKCVEVYDKLATLQPVIDAKNEFKEDIRKLASENLDKNIDYLIREKSSLEPMSGSGADFAAKVPFLKKAKEDRLARVESMKKMAKELVTLKAEQKRMLTIEVGHEFGHGFGDPRIMKTFNPTKKPPYSRTDGPTWEDVNLQWQLAATEISDKAGRYPWLYGLLRDEPGLKQLDQIAAINDPEKAAAEMVSAIAALMNRADAVKKKIGGSVDWYNLVPVRLRLLNEKKWGDLLTFNHWAAIDAVGKRQSEEYWTEFGLQAAAEVGLLAVTLATAGTAPIMIGLIGAAVAVGAPAAAAYTEAKQADNLADLNKGTVLPGTDVVAQAQVDEARAASVAHIVQAAVNAFLAGGALAKHLQLSVRLLNINTLEPAAQRELIAEAVSGMGASKTAELSGRTFRQLLVAVGEDTEAGRLVQKETQLLLQKPAESLSHSELRALGMERGIGVYFSKGARLDSTSRQQALRELLHEAERANVAIDASEDAAAYLDYRAIQQGGKPADYHSVCLGDVILVRPQYAENVRVLREELIHAFQQRAGMASNEVVEGEIQARLMMIQFRHRWAITNDEVREMITEVRRMRKTGKY